MDIKAKIFWVYTAIGSYCFNEKISADYYSCTNPTAQSFEQSYKNCGNMVCVQKDKAVECKDPCEGLPGYAWANDWAAPVDNANDRCESANSKLQLVRVYDQFYRKPASNSEPVKGAVCVKKDSTCSKIDCDKKANGYGLCTSEKKFVVCQDNKVASNGNEFECKQGQVCAQNQGTAAKCVPECSGKENSISGEKLESGAYCIEGETSKFVICNKEGKMVSDSGKYIFECQTGQKCVPSANNAPAKCVPIATPSAASANAQPTPLGACDLSKEGSTACIIGDSNIRLDNQEGKKQENLGPYYTFTCTKFTFANNKIEGRWSNPKRCQYGCNDAKDQCKTADEYKKSCDVKPDIQFAYCYDSNECGQNNIDGIKRNPRGEGTQCEKESGKVCCEEPLESTYSNHCFYNDRYYNKRNVLCIPSDLGVYQKNYCTAASKEFKFASTPEPCVGCCKCILTFRTSGSTGSTCSYADENYNYFRFASNCQAECETLARAESNSVCMASTAPATAC